MGGRKANVIGAKPLHCASCSARFRNVSALMLHASENGHVPGTIPDAITRDQRSVADALIYRAKTKARMV